MTDDEKIEFWTGLSRLYDQTLALRDETIELRKVARHIRGW